jgi:hypothetical protein
MKCGISNSILLFNKSLAQLEDGPIPPGYEQLNMNFLNNFDHLF